VPAVAKLTTAGADALFVATSASVVAGVCAVALLLAHGELGALAPRGRRAALPIIGTLGTAVAFLLFFEGARRSTAVETALCLQIEPVYSLFLARAFLGHRLTPRRLGAVTGILLGIALALGPSGFSGWIGNALLLVTPLAWQASHLIALRALAGIEPRTLTAARYAYGGAVLALVWIATGGVARLPATPALAALAPILVLQGAVLSFVGTLLWYGAIARLDLARCTAIVVPSVPVLSLGASWLLLGEVASARQWAGLLLTAIGVAAFVTAPHAHVELERIPAANAPVAVPDPEG
jgi:drug/metabolite transporter (DMT)-like permease